MKVLIISTPRQPTENVGSNGLGRYVYDLIEFLITKKCSVSTFLSEGSKIEFDNVKKYFWKNEILDIGIVKKVIDLENFELIIDCSHNKLLSKFFKQNKKNVINIMLDEECDYNPINCIVGNKYQQKKYPNSIICSPSIKTDIFPFFEKFDDYCCFAGKIEKRKGFDIAISICKKSKQKLILAGPLCSWDPKSAEEIKKQNWVGEIKDHNEFCNFIGRSKCLLYPSRSEAGGLGILQAMALGVPCITMSGTGTSCFVEHGVTGFIADTIDQASEFVNQIPKLSRIEVRKYCIENFDYKKNYNFIYKIFLEVLNGRTW
jgi:glycosyltransferase involved in cell wall biosynthesis